LNGLQVDQEVRKKLILCDEQDDFVFGDWKYGGFFGEYGNGKTTVACLRSRRLSMEHPNNVGMVLRKVWSDNRDTTLKQFHDFFPEWEQYYKRSEKAHVLPNGSTIFWRGMDRVGRMAQLNNYNLGWFWIEQMEELFPDVWNILEGRLKLTKVPTCGFGTANPAGHNWCWKKFLSPDKSPIYKPFQPPARWNRANLPERYYEEKEENWPSQLIDRYLNGKHEGYEGLIYSIFDRKKHIRDIEVSKYGGQFWEFQDYGISDTNPMVWLFAYKNEFGQIGILEEYYKTKCKLNEAAAKVLSTREILNMGDRLRMTTGCPRAFQKEKDGKSPAEYFASEYGIVLTQSPVRIEVRYPVIWKLFSEGRLWISPKCVNLISELEQLTWDNINTAPNHAIEAMERGIYKIEKAANTQGWGQVDIERSTEQPITANVMNMEF